MFRLICLCIGYCIGCIETAYVVGRIWQVDLRQHGSGNLGTTNALRVLGKKAGALVFIGDIMKSVIAFVICRAIFGSNLAGVYGSVGAVLGHNYPFYLKFKGGKGIAVMIGMTAAMAFSMDIRLAIPNALIGFGMAFATRYVSVGSLLFALTLFSPKDFLAVAFDAGGVTTGPITVPFIMALGVGVSALRAAQGHDDDSFGLVALCSVGPILMVLLLGIFYHPSDATYSAVEIAPVVTTRDVAQQFAIGLPDYAKEVLLSILPIVAVCVLFQLLTHHYRRRQLLRTGVGFLYTVIGLILFLTGVNIGFTPVGNLLGSGLADSTYRWVLIPIGALIGYYIVKAEPAVQVLNKQVEDVTGGTVSQSMMNTALSIGVACAVMLSMVRVLTGISIYWILVPGYALALILARYVPSVFVGIAFDSGGVASGPMTSTFLLPLAMGACTALGGSVVTDAFGVVALVALAPPVAIQIMGVIYVHKAKAVAENKADLLPDDGVIDLEDEEI